MLGRPQFAHRCFAGKEGKAKGQIEAVSDPAKRMDSFCELVQTCERQNKVRLSYCQQTRMFISANRDIQSAVQSSGRSRR